MARAPSSLTTTSPLASAYASLPLPYLIFDPALRLHTINAAARTAFGHSEGVHDGSDRLTRPPGGAEHFFWGTKKQGDLKVDKRERVRVEFDRIAGRGAGRRWSDRDFEGEPQMETNGTDGIECRSGEVRGLRWWSEAVVNRFRNDATEAPVPTTGGAISLEITPTSSSIGNDMWYSVLLLRPLARPPQPTATTPATTHDLSKEAEYPQAIFSPPSVEEQRTASWESYGKTSRPSVEEEWASARSGSSPTTSTAKARSASNNLRLGHLPPPSSPPSHSTGTGSSSSPRSAHYSTGSGSTTATSITSQSAALPGQLLGMGISVSSAGIQLSQSIPPTATLPPVQSIPPRPNPTPLFSPLDNDDTFQLATPTPSSGPMSGHFSRPTALPPMPPPPDRESLSKADLLRFATLSSLPGTGIIVADKDLKCGFVNSLAREILMGVVDGMVTGGALDDDWWTSGLWSSDDGLPDLTSATSNSTTASGSTSSFFPLSSAHSERQNPFDARDLSHSAIIRDGEAKLSEKSKGVGGTNLRIGKPSETNRYRTTVANILLRSLITLESRRSSRLEPRDYLPAGSAQGKKPYKVYDSTFSQRIIDPFEPILEICAQRGEELEKWDGEDGSEGLAGLIVGIEIEVWEEDHGDEGWSGEKSSKRKRARRRLVEISGAPVYAPGSNNTKHLGGVIVLRDVTDEARKVAISAESQNLRRRQGGAAYFKHIVDHMPQMTWTTTAGGSHDYFNRQWYTYTGLEPEQSLGTGWQNPFHEDDMPATIKAWSHSLQTGDPYSVEYRCRRHDGEWRWMLGRALPFRDQQGKVVSWFGTCTDVHEFVNIRSELAKKQEQFAAIIKAAQVLIWAVDSDYTINFFEGSQSSSIIAAHNNGQSVIGRSMRELWPRSVIYEGMDLVLSGKQPAYVHEWVPDELRLTFHRCSVSPLTETRPDGSVAIVGAIIVAMDVTDLHDAQEKLRESYEERTNLRASEEAAKEASRLKSEFVANISHEIRTPIAGMIGLAELLLDEELPEAHRTAISKIMRSGEILLSLVGMVLDMQKVESGKLDLDLHPFALSELLSDTRMFSVPASKKGVQFVEDVGALYQGMVLGDMPRLRQVISNLLSNAIKFTAHGTVTLRVTQEEESASQLRVKFIVEDTGVGIREEAIPLLFQPFHQADASTHRQFGGTGLGLCIAKNLVELMGGSISLESRFGVGTTMTVMLPIAKAPLVPSIPSSPAVATPTRNLVREDTWILVADDNELNREIITKTVRKMRFNVHAVTNGQEAIDAVQERHYDLFLCDQQMPKKDGLTATKEIRQFADPSISSIKIIALTASATRADMERCLAAGMNGYLSKPVRSKLLESTILHHLLPPTSSPASPVLAAPIGNGIARQLT